MATKPQQVELPPKYYLDYFRYLTGFVRRMYGHLLNGTEQEFIRRFDDLTEDAQCMYVRFSNRRGTFFRVQKLQYKEIDDLPAAVGELLMNGFIERLSSHHEVLGDEVLNTFTKPELLELLPLEPEELKPLAKAKKENIVRYSLHELDFSRIVDSLTRYETVVKSNFDAEVMMLKYLFFGNRSGDMSEFVIRDLGMVTFERYDESKLSARFANRKEVEDKLMISLTNEAFRELRDSVTPPEDVFNWFMNWDETRPELSEIAQPGYAKLVTHVGGFLEREKMPEQAMQVYNLTDRVPARERRVRLLFRSGLTEEALALCDEIALSPQNADERYFANDFREKILSTAEKKRSRKATTRFLSDAESVGIPAIYRHHVEAGVMNHFLEAGWEAAFTENYPWRGLFGLVFWDIIYDANVQAIHHPLQRTPSDFYLPDFYLKREALLKSRLANLKTRQDWKQHIETVFFEKYGMTNVLVDWNEEQLSLNLQMVDLLEPEQLGLVMLEISRNLRENTRGFPDLLIWNEQGDYEFVEVKSPTDHLGAQQLHWLEFFQMIGVRSRVLRVIWTV